MNEALASKYMYLWVETGKLWFTYTLQARAVQRTAHRTQTHKRPLAVPALSINTGAGLTLVHVWRDRNKHSWVWGGRRGSVQQTEGTSHPPSQTSVLGLKEYPLGHWQVKLPGVFLHRPFSHSSLLIRHSSISEEGAQTQQRADGVLFSFSKGRLESCPPHTDAAFARQVHLVAFVAGAFVRPQHVLTHAVLADVGVESALVDVCEGKGPT